MEREKVTISIDMVRDMIREIDIRLIPQLRDLDDYSEKQGIYRIGDYGYVAEKIFDKAFDDYNEDYGADWAGPLYMLEANQPEYLEFFVQAYNYGGLELLEHLLSLQFENDDADVVYYTTGSDC